MAGTSADGSPEDRRQPAGELHLPPQVLRLFDESDTNGFYYLVETHHGQMLRSVNAPDLKLVGHAPQPPVPGGPESNPSPPPPRMRDNYREVEIVTPSGDDILVGRSVASELAGLRLVAVELALVGGGVLLLGLAGGWWLATRAIQPIEDISATAIMISAGDLSQRINTVDTDSELGRLATVLNSTFARLETAFAQQKQFTSDAAHELRTPVSVMLTQTQTSLNRERSAAEYRDTVETCQRAAQRMRRLIESLLELSRLDAGQESMKRLPLDLARVAADCVEHVRPLAANRNITIKTDFSASECRGDSDRLAQVITNLLSNAINYNHENGEIRVAVRTENGSALLTVGDSGPGIAPEHLPHIFDRFYRADAARTTSQGRSGLGLAISKSIVEAHGGTLEAVSHPGLGAKFTVRIPTM